MDVQASLRVGDRVYGFNSIDPTGEDLATFPLAPKSGRTAAFLLGGYAYTGEGNAVFRSKDGKSQRWFQSERPFFSCMLLDSRTLALAWVRDSAPEGDFLSSDLLAKETPGFSFLEIWDVPSHSLLCVVKAPEELKELAGLFQPFNLVDLWMIRSGDTVLLYLPMLNQLYRLEDRKEIPSFSRIKTPWPAIEAEWVGKKLKGLKSPRVTVPQVLMPMYLCITPAPDRSLKFSCICYPPLTGLVDTYLTPLLRGQPDLFALLPGVLTPSGKDPKEWPSPFRAGVWKEGQDEVQPLSFKGPVNLEDKTDVKNSGLEKAFWGQGVFMTARDEPKPLIRYFEEVAREHREKFPPLPPEKPKSTPAQGK